jgi:hypothetical protein
MAKTTSAEGQERFEGAAGERVQGVEAVVRRCQVCEWEGEVIEAPGADPDCPWCHGPTARMATLATSAEPVAGAKNPHAAALGRLGGLKGGRARAQALTPSQRRRIASRAAQARWDKKRRDDHLG